ncbi:MAG: universal stress protein [Armatimonadota bacterium]|nr:universal stress protein [Armatimonadota bacterium]
MTRILVPMDFSRDASLALRWAAALATSLKAKVSVLHVIDLTQITMAIGHHDLTSARVIDGVFKRVRADAEANMARAARRYPRARTVIREGNPRAVILDTAKRERADLIVMGTHGRTGLARLLFGSVAEHVVRHSPVPVLTVRQQKRS